MSINLSDTVLPMPTLRNFLRELGELLEKAGARNSEYEYFFRGEAKTHPDVRPSLYSKEYFIQNEDYLFKECLRMWPQEFENEHTAFEKLARMQHFALPTRLLDITGNPLVALFFASQERKNKCNGKEEEQDGRIIVLRVPKKKIKFSDSDTVSAISNIAKLRYRDLDISACVKKEYENDTTFTNRFNKEHMGYLLHEIRAEKPYYQSIIRKEDLESVWCVKPLLKNIRLIRQDGLFLLFGIKGKKGSFAPIGNWTSDENNDDIAISKVFTISAQNKREIRRNLEYMGFSTDKLFPGLEEAAKYLKQKAQEIPLYEDPIA